VENVDFEFLLGKWRHLLEIFGRNLKILKLKWRVVIK
jgi:hypothetical protein